LAGTSLTEGSDAGAAAPDEVTRLLGRFPETSPPHGSAGAAVTIVLRSGLSDVEVLLIERAVRDGDPASGQIGLPGGRVDEGEGALVNTALRECEEEVGIGAGDLAAPPRFVGFSMAPAVGLQVGVFAAELGPSRPGPTARDPVEVAHVFWIPRSALRHSRRVVRETLSGSREVDANVVDGHVLWGFTRRVLLDFFEIPDVGAPL
jgi:8-oxo-dGTP pyrophosphatase MutT (NUDIX family)